MALSDLVGTWRLLSFEAHVSGGESSQPFGSDPEGSLVYDSAGNFSVQVARSGRPHFASDDMQDGTADEIRGAYLGYIAYFGAYDVNEAEGYLTHKVDVSLFPNWQGVPQQRFFALSGNTLTLTTPPTPFGGREVTGVLVWERAS
jgi:hypothetical protein